MHVPIRSPARIFRTVFCTMMSYALSVIMFSYSAFVTLAQAVMI